MFPKQNHGQLQFKSPKHPQELLKQRRTPTTGMSRILSRIISFHYLSSRTLRTALNLDQIIVQVLLPQPFRVHRIQNRLSLRLVLAVQIVDLSLHLHIDVLQSRLQIVEAQEL